MSLPYHLYTRSEWDATTARGQTAGNVPRSVYVHHTASQDHPVVLKQMKAAVKGIQTFHMTDPDHMWSDIAYHFVVFQPTEKHPHAIPFAGRRLSAVPAAQLGHNVDTLAIAVYGDGNRDAMHPNTRFVIEELVREFAPRAQVIGGHRDAGGTDCPGDKFYAAIPTIAHALGLRHI